ncbi:hypothetical protein OTU49_010708, partial [Cherax quadricarinatus]
NSHGTPGIYFKYDVSALKVEVVERHESLIKFLTRLCGIVGGVFTCSGLISRFVGLLVSCLTCRFFREEANNGKFEEKTSKLLPGPPASLLLQSNLTQQPDAAVPQLTSTTITPITADPHISDALNMTCAGT